MDDISKILQSVEAINHRLETLTDLVKSSEYKREFMYWFDKSVGGEDVTVQKERFFRSIKFDNEDTRIIQKALLILVKEFDRICKKNSIDYWIDGGTMLGALRHGGFVPWHEGLDLNMLRTDIEKLSEALKSEDTFIELKDFICIGRAVYNIVRIEYNDKDAKIFINIFPQDFCDSDSIQSLWSKHLAYRDEYVNRTYRYKPLVRKEPGLDIWEQRKVINPDDDIIIRNELKYMNEEMGANNTKGEYVVWGIDNAGGGKMRGRIALYADVFPLKYVDFESIKLKAPNNLLKRCKDRYGDPYTLPDHIIHEYVNMTFVKESIRMIEKYENTL